MPESHLTSQVALTLDRHPRPVAMSAHDDFESYLKLVKGGLTAGREQIYNFLKFDQLVAPNLSACHAPDILPKFCSLRTAGVSIPVS